MKSKLTLFTFLIHIPGLVEHESLKKILIKNIDKIWSKCNIKKNKNTVTVHTGIQERGDEDCDKRGI